MQIAPTPGLAVLIGGAGFIGTAVAESLARAGWQLRIASRNPERAHRLKPLGDVGQISFARADLRAPASIAAAPLTGARLMLPVASGGISEISAPQITPV